MHNAGKQTIVGPEIDAGAAYGLPVFIAAALNALVKGPGHGVLQKVVKIRRKGQRAAAIRQVNAEAQTAVVVSQHFLQKLQPAAFLAVKLDE